MAFEGLIRLNHQDDLVFSVHKIARGNDEPQQILTIFCGRYDIAYFDWATQALTFRSRIVSGKAPPPSIMS